VRRKPPTTISKNAKTKKYVNSRPATPAKQYRRRNATNGFDLLCCIYGWFRAYASQVELVGRHSRFLPGAMGI
jgi:hypothetical protein